MIVLSLVPVGCGLILLLVKPLLENEGVDLSTLYPQVSFFLFLHFLLPLMSVFIGSAILADEVDERTLPYLLVRPVPRRNIVLAKTLAGVVTVGFILFVSLGLTYTVMVLDGGVSGWISNVPKLLQSGGVLLLGLLVYVPLFGFFGGTIKRPVLAGLFFTFGWENTVGMFPGNAKLFTVVHYLHILFPKMQQVRLRNARSALLELVLPAKQISPVLAILILLGLSAVFIALTVSLLYVREYRLEQS
jgi:ABC-2 type transport system permease protein